MQAIKSKQVVSLSTQNQIQEKRARTNSSVRRKALHQGKEPIGKMDVKREGESMYAELQFSPTKRGDEDDEPLGTKSVVTYTTLDLGPGSTGTGSSSSRVRHGPPFADSSFFLAFFLSFLPLFSSLSASVFCRLPIASDRGSECVCVTL